MSGEGSSVDAMDGDMSFVDESVIGGCHPWMTDMNGAFISLHSLK